jgi:hypothetical protein
MEASDLDASRSPSAATATVTYHGPKDGSPADALHVHHDDGSETILPLGVPVLVTPEVAEQVTSDHNLATYDVERG